MEGGRFIVNDPHVESLRYRISTDDTRLVLDRPNPLVVATGDFDVALDDAKNVMVAMKAHSPTVAEARNVVDRYLESWATYHAITGNGGFRFEYVDATVVDRNPPPPGSDQSIRALAVSDTARVSERVTVKVTRRDYPQPPADFVADGDVQVMWQRYQSYRAGRESILVMAYFCYTVACTRGKGRAGTIALLNVDGEVFDAVWKISAEFGGPAEARKIVPKGNQILTPQHRQWLEKTVKELILRMGRVAAGKINPERLEMKDLPAIPKP